MQLREQVDRERVFEADRRWLRRERRAECGTAVIRQSFQIDRRAEFVQQRGLAGSGAATEHDQAAAPRRTELLDDVEAGSAQRLVATVDPRDCETFAVQPVLHDLRSQAAAPAIQHRVGVGIDERDPRVDPRASHRAGNERFAECDRGLLAARFVARADGRAFVVGQQRQIDCVWKGALSKLRGRAQIDQRHTVAQYSPMVGDDHGTGSITVSPR